MKKQGILEGIDFTELDDDFYLEVEFEAIKTFRIEGSFSFLRNGHSHGYIGISFERSEEDKPSQSQINSLNYFQKNQEQILNSLCKSFLQEYPKIMHSYEQDNFDSEIGFPELRNPEDVKKLIGIDGLSIRNQDKDDISYFGLSCCCPWDIEHGLGILMHQDRIILVDHADLCYAGGRIEIEKDNGTYSEEKHRKEMEKFEKSRAEYILSLSKEDDNKKWWQFWR